MKKGLRWGIGGAEAPLWWQGAISASGTCQSKSFRLTYWCFSELYGLKYQGTFPVCHPGGERALTQLLLPSAPRVPWCAGICPVPT